MAKFSEQWLETEFEFSREYQEELFAARVAIPEAAKRATDIGPVVQFARRMLRDAWIREISRNKDLRAWLINRKQRRIVNEAAGN